MNLNPMTALSSRLQSALERAVLDQQRMSDEHAMRLPQLRRFSLSNPAFRACVKANQPALQCCCCCYCCCSRVSASARLESAFAAQTRTRPAAAEARFQVPV